MMNGGVTIGSRDGKNLEILSEIGNSNIYLFEEGTEPTSEEIRERIKNIEKFFLEKLELSI